MVIGCVAAISLQYPELVLSALACIIDSTAGTVLHSKPIDRTVQGWP